MKKPVFFTFISKHRWLILSLSLALVLIWIAYANGLIPDYFYGEEYDKIRYPGLNNHFDSWINYFYDKGRPIEGIYWTYFYEFFSYQPKLFHLFSILLHFTAAFLASIAFMRLVKKTNNSAWLHGFLFLLLFFNAYSLNYVFRISLDAPVIALITLYASVITFQNYAQGQFKNPTWLFLSVGFFLLTIFNYEVASFLFPVGLILSWPLVDSQVKKKRKWLGKLFVAGGLLSCFLVLLPLEIYRYYAGVLGQSVANPAVNFGEISISSIFIQAPMLILTYILEFGTGLFPGDSWQRVVFVFLLIAPVVAGSMLIIDLFRKKWSFKAKIFNNPRSATIIAAGWIFILGSLPYALIGYEASAIRTYSAAIFGVLLLCVLSVDTFRNTYLKMLGLLIMIGSMLIGVNHYLAEARAIKDLREFNFRYFLEFTEIIPELKERTNLIFVNHGVGSLSGCPGMFMLLYETREISCGFLSDSDPDRLAERYNGQINAHLGGWSRYGNDILIGRNAEGHPYIIPSISPESDLLIIWHDPSPITTDFRRIGDEEKYLTSAMYQYLISNWNQ